MNDRSDVETRLTGALHEIAQCAPSVQAEPRSADGAHMARVRRSALAAAAGAVAVAVVISAGLITAGVIRDTAPHKSHGSSVAAPEPRTSVRETEASVPLADRAVQDCHLAPTVSAAADSLSRLGGEPLWGMGGEEFASGLSADGFATDPNAEEPRSGLSADEFAAASLLVINKIGTEYGPHQPGAVMRSDDMAGIVVAMVRPWSGSVEELEAVVGVPVTACLVDEPPVPVSSQDPALSPSPGASQTWWISADRTLVWRTG